MQLTMDKIKAKVQTEVAEEMGAEHDFDKEDEEKEAASRQPKIQDRPHA